MNIELIPLDTTSDNRLFVEFASIFFFYLTVFRAQPRDLHPIIFLTDKPSLERTRSTNAASCSGDHNYTTGKSMGSSRAASFA
jgi:hypothetical protein